LLSFAMDSMRKAEFGSSALRLAAIWNAVAAPLLLPVILLLIWSALQSRAVFIFATASPPKVRCGCYGRILAA